MDAVDRPVGGLRPVIEDPRIDEIARATRRREGDAAAVLTGLMLAEEAGEAVQQLRRHLGHARTAATGDDVGAELADVVITAAVLAQLLDIDLSRAIEAKLREGAR